VVVEIGEVGVDLLSIGYECWYDFDGFPGYEEFLSVFGWIVALLPKFFLI